MKKIYLLLVGAGFVLSGMAQVKHAPSALGKSYGSRDGVVATPVVPGSADRVTIWSDDFSDCGVWDIVNANDAGFPAFIEDVNFECGINPPSGPALIDEIASPTSANGYMSVDSDLFGGSTGGDWVENCWFQNVDAIDITGYDFVSVQFYNQYRMWDGGASDGNEYCLLEISTDGVTWPSPETFEVSEAPAGTRFELWPTMETQDPVDNPTLKIFDISNGLPDGATQLWLRFRWKGTWGYAWMVDDVEVFETPESDLTVANVYNGDFVADYEYAKIPTTQVGDLNFGAILANYGYTPQNGTTVDFEISGPSSYSTTASATLPASSLDTLWTGPQDIGNAVGTYTLTVTVPADDLPEGDSREKDFEITQDIYGHNNEVDLVQRGFDQDDEIAIGCTYFMTADGEAGGIQVLFGSNTDANQEVKAYIYEIGEDIQDLSYLGESDDFLITNSMINTGEYVIIPFDGSVEVIGGSGYVVELRKEESGDRLYLLSNVLDVDLGTVNYGPFGAGDVVNWFVGWNWSPSVQLIMDPSIAVNETVAVGNIELLQNSPNPATTLTNITYNLTEASNVTLTVRDMTGRSVKVINEGVKARGKQTISLNVADLSAGVYTYTLADGVSSITNEMIVR
ncbi:MAG: T9SS type A sorting domain-containing protein [Flavobacteriales bacterium]|nr:T9SS type A sorting domain-containing protein [Flavobacteriales bacterium]